MEWTLRKMIIITIMVINSMKKYINLIGFNLLEWRDAYDRFS